MNRALCIFAAAACLAQAPVSFHVAGDEPGAWPEILGSIGLVQAADGNPAVTVIAAGAVAPPEIWLPRIEQGALVVMEGASPLAAALGIKPGARQLPVRNVQDLRRPDLAIVWEKTLTLPVFEMPDGARVLAKERWEGAPLMAAVRCGQGAALWLAAAPGPRGYDRFPYLLEALRELGLRAPVRGNRLWAFFDASYRARIDPEYFAARWRKAGIGALHVAAWRYFEPDAARDAYLEALIRACHRHAILVYAWLELPHVSERFWDEHPEWREKTALGQDAHLDWRKLMNLANRDAFRAAAQGVRALVRRFDWDGVNLAELYFESLEGAANPARFTPFNEDVRRMFREKHGAEPSLDQRFLDFRAELALAMQLEWIGELEAMRREQPHLDLVLTHVDDRFDTRMRDLIGADAARLLPLLDQRDFTFLIEDPATVWHLGPQRYPEIAARYQPLTPHKEKLAIDINIVERYQDVYPTKQQTGTELFQLVNVAGKAFPRVALYFENSVAPEDVVLLSSAAAGVTRAVRSQGKLLVDSPYGAGIPWRGNALVNGRLWPAADGETLWLAAGAHTVEPATEEPPLRLLDFQGTLRSARARTAAIEFAYESQTRALAIVDKLPKRVEIDGIEAAPRTVAAGNRHLLYLPRGQHVVSLAVEPPPPTD